MSKIDIYIGYNERLINEGICSLINTHQEYNIIGSCLNGDELLKSLKNFKIGVLIVELGYPNKCNLKYIAKLKANYPQIKLLLITSFFKQGIINNFIDLGVEGYILKQCTTKDLYSAIDNLANNENYFCSSVTQLLLKEFQDLNVGKNEFLTAREIEVMKFLIDGLSNFAIAKKLRISLYTVKTHRKNIMDKFGSKNMISMIRYACRENLIDHDNGFFCLSCPYKLATKSYQLSS
jgi:DNA-binding NarL/FixJ family response regulator